MVAGLSLAKLYGGSRSPTGEDLRSEDFDDFREVIDAVDSTMRSSFELDEERTNFERR